MQQKSMDYKLAQSVIDRQRELSHPCVFITYETLCGLGELRSYEELRNSGVQLVVLDVYSELLLFAARQSTVFIRRARGGAGRSGSALTSPFRLDCSLSADLLLCCSQSSVALF